MQTETIFRAARALTVIGDTIRENAPALAFSFHGKAGVLSVILSGLPVGEGEDVTPNTLIGAAQWISGIGEALDPDDAFRLEFVQGKGVAAQFRVEAA